MEEVKKKEEEQVILHLHFLLRLSATKVLWLRPQEGSLFISIQSADDIVPVPLLLLLLLLLWLLFSEIVSSRKKFLQKVPVKNSGGK